MRSGCVSYKIGFVLVLSLSFCYPRAQEICNNGIDDDGDGKIDLNDESCMKGIFSLIRNPSFEWINGCPDNWSKLHYAIHWMQPHPTAGSTDLYHKCGDCSYQSLGIVQQSPLPAPHGDGFAGFYDTQQYDLYGEYKEYLATCLSATLKKNTTYRVRFSLGFLNTPPSQNALHSRSPVNLSFFGNPSCNAVQYSNGFRRCPMTMQGDGWTELKRIEVGGNPGDWVTVEAEFESLADIKGLVIGPSCAPTVHGGHNYYLIDQVFLYEKDAYHIPQIERKGDICADTLVLTGKIAPDPAFFNCQWYRNGVALPGETAPALKLTRGRYGEGGYSIRYTINGTHYLSPEEMITINDLKFYLPDTVAFCNNTKVSLSPDFYHIPTTCPITYLWQDGSTKQTFEATAPGVHWLETNKNGCRFRDSVFVLAYDAPTVKLGADTALCPGEQLTLRAGDSNLVYRWQDGSTKNSYIISKAGTYAVAVSNGYCVSADTIVVHYKKLPEVRFDQDSLLCEGEEKVLKPFLYGDEFRWNTGSTSPEITINKPGVYEVTAKNQCGIASKAHIITKSNCLFFLPDAFTPNGDGKNDRFGLKEYGFIRRYSISIFNRWGEVVYQSSDPASQWSGWFKGKIAIQGVYVWITNYTDWLGRNFSRKGTLVLIR